MRCLETNNNRNVNDGLKIIDDNDGDGDELMAMFLIMIILMKMSTPIYNEHDNNTNNSIIS